MEEITLNNFDLTLIEEERQSNLLDVTDGKPFIIG